MSAGAAPGIGLELIQRIEAHCVDAWPAQEVERWSDGWIMRATPGLPGRGRSNHALVPVRPLRPGETDGALARVAAFSARHGVQCGLQVGPIDLHIALLGELQVRGWDVQQSVCVMTADGATVAAATDPEFELVVSDHADDAWVSAWSACEPNRTDVQAHVDTVFKYLRGHGRFFRHGADAVGLSVEQDGIIGLFCLAVRPDERGKGLGTKLVSGMLADEDPGATVYLQVFGTNIPALALYSRLGFTESYRYCHCVAPEPQRSASAGAVESSCC